MSNNEKVSVKARVQVVLEVTLDQPWDPYVTAAQVYQQARREARARVEQQVVHPNVRIVGEPLVTMVLAEEKTT